MTGQAPALIAAAVAALLVLLYYGFVVRLVGEPLARRTLTVVVRLPLARRWTFADLDGVARLLLAGGMQLCFLAVLLLALPLSVAALVPADVDPVLLLLGVPLGVAEAGLATYAAYVAARIAERVRPGDGTPTTVEGWLSVARGGWIRYYLRTAAVAPRWLVVAATVLYVAGEELVFRGVVLTTADRLLPAVALALSVVLFAAAQVFYTPGWRTALFPVMGAVVVGLVHGSLFLAVPDVTPLIVAHATMFLVTVL